MKQLYNFRFTLLVCLCLTMIYSCSDDDDNYTETPLNVLIINQNNASSIAQEDTLYLKADIEHSSNSDFFWLVDGIKQSEDSLFKFTRKEIGKHVITLTAKNADGEYSASLNIDVYGKYRHGTFILNEGNMSSENGSLIFISPKGEITDSVYSKVNGTELGNVAQDLFISDGRMYIISQNGKRNTKSDGLLIVANAETLKKEVAYNDELAALSWASHISVLNDGSIYIRDGIGIHLFNPNTKKLSLIKGTSGALKNRMAVADNKVFIPANKSVLVLEQGKDSISLKLDMEATVSGIIKSSDGNIWVSTTGSPAKISKIDARNYSIIKSNEIAGFSLNANSSSTPAIGAIGDTLYLQNSFEILRHIFSKNETLLMVNVKDHVEDAGRIYNSLGVHPATGEVYFNTIKSFGSGFLINNISVFDFNNTTAPLKRNYKDYTNFPAGIYFTENFK